MNKFFLSDEDKLIWKKTETKDILSTRVMTVTETTSISPEGDTKHFVVMDAPDWVIVIPEIYINNIKNFIMVKQWRHGSNSISIEFPGGVIDKGESPLEAAKRELLEETGFLTDEMIFLGSISPNPAIMSNKVHFYCAKNMHNTHKLNLDDDEYVHYAFMKATDVFSHMGGEKFTHGLTCAACHMYNRYNSNNSID